MIKSLRNLFKSSRRESDKEVARLYYLYKEKFLVFLVNNNDIDEDVAADIYHESFLIMHRDILSEKLEDTSDITLKRYLFNIGYKLMLKHFREERKLPKTDLAVAPELSDPERDSLEWRQKEEIARNVVAKMKKPCKDLLDLFYWKEMDIEEIVESMDYKDKDSAKAQKYKCKEKLIAELKNRFPNEDWTRN